MSLPFIAPYASAHASPSGLGDARPTAHQILQDEGLLTVPNRLTDKAIVITGGTSGLGLELAKELHLTGARVFITGRSAEKGKEALSSMTTSGSAAVVFVQMDQSDFDSVRRGVSELLTKTEDLHLLICNAGVMSPRDLTRTKQGHEMQFGVNVLSHFLLFELLYARLLKGSESGLSSRVIMVSSCAHRGSGLAADGDYDFCRTQYSASTSYGASKTANIYLANHIDRLHSAHGIRAFSAHPGIILETNLVRHITDDREELEKVICQSGPTFKGIIKNTGQGAATIMWAAVANKLEGKGGLYLEDCSVGQPVKDGDQWWDSGIATWCYDQKAEEKLWETCREMYRE